MRSALAQPSAVYPLPTRAFQRMAAVAFAAAISLPLPSGQILGSSRKRRAKESGCHQRQKVFLDMISR